MKKIKMRFIIFTLIGVAILFTLSFGRAFPSMAVNIKESGDGVKMLPMSGSLYYRQTLNNCAPYSVMAVINIVQHKEIDPERLARETNWRIYKNLTFPQGLIDLLKKYRIRIREYNLYLYREEEKVRWLKNMLERGSPIILLVDVEHVKHYFTVLGYDESGFMLYDSLQEKTKDNPRKTIVDRKEYSGNRYYTNDELIRLWDSGGYKIFFNNWAVVCE